MLTAQQPLGQGDLLNVLTGNREEPFFLTHRIPYPPNKRDKIRAFHEIEHLSRQHEIHLACLVDREEDFAYVRDLEVCRTVTAVRLTRLSSYLRAGLSLLRGEPLSLGYFDSCTLRWCLSGLLERMTFDRVVVFSSSMAHYVASYKACPKVLDMVDVDSDKWAQYARRAPFPWSRIYALEAERLARCEGELAAHFDQVVFVTAPEVEPYRRTAPNAACSVVTNGVDLEYFSPPTTREPGPRLVFTGAMDYYANVDAMTFFCDEIFPLIRARRPDGEMVIVGSHPVRVVRRLSQRPGVVVTGTVRDVRPYLASARVFVAPLRVARGIQNKILEAMAMGLPVVVSSAAAAALPAGKGLMIAEGAEPFACAVLGLLDDPGLWSESSGEARRLVEHDFDWNRSMQQFEDIVLASRAVPLPSAP